MDVCRGRAGGRPVRARAGRWPRRPRTSPDFDVDVADAADQEPDDDDQDAQEEAEDREQDAYDEGTDAIDEEEWAQAVRQFDRVVAMNGKRADARPLLEGLCAQPRRAPQRRAGRHRPAEGHGAEEPLAGRRQGPRDRDPPGVRASGRPSSRSPTRR